MTLEQKARKALKDRLNYYRCYAIDADYVIDEILSKSWRDLGEDSDEPVFLIGHPEQRVIHEDLISDAGRAMAEAINHCSREDGWRRTLGGK